MTDIDPRQRRTRAALYTAALELAAERGVDGMTVTALATRAGVHRSTVYEHCSSPIELLQAALAAELDALRDEHLRDVAGDGIAAALRDVSLGVFAHVEHHAAIYRTLGGGTGSTMHAFLSEHFQESTRILLARSTLQMPQGVPGVDDALLERAAVRYIADGVVGIIAVWLDSPEPRDPEAPLAMLTHLTPEWWPQAPA